MLVTDDPLDVSGVRVAAVDVGVREILAETVVTIDLLDTVATDVVLPEDGAEVDASFVVYELVVNDRVEMVVADVRALLDLGYLQPKPIDFCALLCGKRGESVSIDGDPAKTV